MVIVVLVLVVAVAVVVLPPDESNPDKSDTSKTRLLPHSSSSLVAAISAGSFLDRFQTRTGTSFSKARTS